MLSDVVQFSMALTWGIARSGSILRAMLSAWSWMLFILILDVSGPCQQAGVIVSIVLWFQELMTEKRTRPVRTAPTPPDDEVLNEGPSS